MYLGNSDNCTGHTYYLPLLPVMKIRNKAEDAEKIEQLEHLPKIQILNNEVHYGFPDECNVLFSHGGYAVIYRTLSNGDTCLSFKDIPSTDKDELGRDIPFNILLIANSDESKSKLENFAFYVKDNYNECMKFCTKLFSYDYIVNGIKFDLPAIVETINSLPDCKIMSRHINNQLIYLMLHSETNIDIAFREQNLNYNITPYIIDTKGELIKGCLLTENDFTRTYIDSETEEYHNSNDIISENNNSISENTTEEKEDQYNPKSCSNEIAELKVFLIEILKKIEKLNEKTDDNHKSLKEDIDKLLNKNNQNKFSVPFIRKLIETIKQYISK